MSLVNVGSVSKFYGAERIFQHVSFQVSRGDKVALVGVNGAGKSTLLKIVAGIEDATSGIVTMARGVRVAYLAQEAQFGGTRTLWEEMQVALERVLAMRDEMTRLEALIGDTAHPEWEARMEEYGELAHRFELAGGYEIDYQIDRTLKGLSFTEAQFHQPVAEFSGGQKTRAALAATLLSSPDVLLLDEPTNHLDLAALEWLERFLKAWEGTLIVISHDRYFLDRVTTRTLDMAFGRLEDYPAPYNKFLQLKAERLELQLKQFNAQQETIAKTEEFIRRFKAGQRSKEARGREKRLNRLKEGFTHMDGTVEQLIERPDQYKKLSMKLTTDQRSGEIVLRLERLIVGYPGNPPKQLIRAPDLEIHRGQRVALVGPNGCGKTTLLKTSVGDVEPLRGAIRQGYRVTVNYYAQSHEGLNMRSSVLNEVWRIDPSLKEVEARTLLGRFLFSGDDVFKQVGDLSGGERSRLALAQMMLLRGNLLILDEPTNHLDIDAREALETMLNEYNGTILFVSHDRYFIDEIADIIWLVEDGTITPFEGSYSDLLAMREAAEKKQASAKKAESASAAPSTNGTHPAPVAPVASVAPAAPRKQLSKDEEREERKRQRKVATLESEIATLEADMQRVEREITAASQRGDAGKVTTLSNQYAAMQETLQTRYDEWSAVAG